MSPHKKWIKVEMHVSLIEKIDFLVQNNLHPSRQSAVNHFIRQGLQVSETQMFYKDLFDQIITRLNEIDNCIKLLNASHSLTETDDTST